MALCIDDQTRLYSFELTVSHWFWCSILLIVGITKKIIAESALEIGKTCEFDDLMKSLLDKVCSYVFGWKTKNHTK